MVNLFSEARCFCPQERASSSAKRTKQSYIVCLLGFDMYFVSAYLHSQLNEHYRPVMELCHPCAVQYDVYTNFKYLPEDAFRIMDLLDIPHHFYLNEESHPRKPTSTLLDDFYNSNVTSRLGSCSALLSSVVYHTCTMIISVFEWFSIAVSRIVGLWPQSLFLTVEPCCFC